MFGVRVANLSAVPCRPRPDAAAAPVGVDPYLDRVSSRERLVDRRRGLSLAAIGIRQADVARHLEDDRVVDAVTSRGPIAAIYVADEVRVRVAPLEHGGVRPHDRQPEIGILASEDGVLAGG